MEILSQILHHIIDGSDNAFIVFDNKSHIVMWSDHAEEMFGWKRHEAIGQNVIELIIPERLREQYSKQLLVAIKKGKKENLSFYLQVYTVDKNKKEVLTELTLRSFNIEGKLFFNICIHDKTTQTIYEKSLKQQAALLNLTQDGILVVNDQQIITFWNKGAERLYGYTKEKAIGKTISTLLKTEYPIPIADIVELLKKNQYWEGELIHTTKTNKKITVLSRWAVETNLDGEITRVLISNTDITESKAYQNRVHYLATHDVLTGLGNRSLLEERLQHAIDTAAKEHSSIATFFIDLNRFKYINDTLGHDQGDLLLREIAGRISRVLSKGDTIARLGGDEFVIVIENVHDIENITQIAKRILSSIEQPFMLGLQEVNVSASIGISMYPRDATDYNSLMKLADVAMYRAKESITGSFRFYNPEMNDLIINRLSIENSLYKAFNKKEFLLYYQPRIHTKTKKIVSAEALIRWNHDHRGIVSPNEFIPMAEEIGLIDLIGEWVLLQACYQNKRWQDMGLPKIKVSVNLTAQQISSPDIINTLSNVLQTTQLEPQYLELEITESGLMKNIELVKENIINTRKLGVSIAIDDFGTGYSSLYYLKKLPIDTIKIDKMFVNDLGSNQDDDAIVTATIAMAHSMNMHAVAEGITSGGQLEFLKEKDCDEMQGYLFSEPLPAKDMEEALTKELWF